MIKAYRRGAKIIVADPRSVPMVKFSEVFLNVKPGTDIALINGIAHVILKEGLQNEHRSGAEGASGQEPSASEIEKDKKTAGGGPAVFSTF